MDDNDMFEEGDPWDHILNVTATLEKLIVAHNNLTDDVLNMRKKQKILDARMQELRRLLVNEDSLHHIQRPKQ